MAMSADLIARLDGIAVCCRACVHQEGRTCGKYDAVPPPEVAAKGCESWTYDEVPF